MPRKLLIGHLPILLIKYWPLLTLIIIIFAFFAKLFFPLSIFVTPDYGRSDAWHLSIANKFYYAQELKKNRIPIWNPHIGTGFPTLAEGQTGIFFLPNLVLFRLLPFVLAYNLNIVLTFVLAATGTYLFCRSLNLTKIVSLYGGLIFALGGFLMVHIPHLHLIQTASLLPWLFWATNEFFQKRKIIYLILLSIILSQQIFAGFPQITFYSLVGLAIYSAFKIWKQKTKLKLTLFLILSIIPGFTIAAIQIVPSYEFLSISIREARPRLVLEQFPYKPINLLQFLDPFILGTPQDDSYPRWTPGKWGIFWENTAYIGILPLALAIAIIVVNLSKKTKGKLPVSGLAFLALFSILLALGGNSPLHPIFSFPPFSLFRVPSRFLLITQFSLVILATLYFQKISGKKLLGNLILILSVLNLYLTFAPYNLLGNADGWFSDPQTAQWLKKEKVQRIFTIGQLLTWNENFFGKGWQNNNYFYFARNSLDQNSNLIFGINQFAAYESLLTKRTTVLTTTVVSGGMKIDKDNKEILVAKPIPKILASANISHIISPSEIKDDQFSKVFESDKFNGYSFKIFQNKLQPRRFFMTSKYQVAISIPQIAKIVTNENFDPLSEVILEKEPIPPKLDLKEYLVSLIEESPTAIKFNVNVSGNGLFVLSDSFYPGWKAFVDSRPVEIYAANINSRAIIVSQGEHEILFKYQPKSVHWGFAVTTVSLASALFLLIKYRNLKIA